MFQLRGSIIIRPLP